MSTRRCASGTYNQFIRLCRSVRRRLGLVHVELTRSDHPAFGNPESPRPVQNSAVLAIPVTAKAVVSNLTWASGCWGVNKMLYQWQRLIGIRTAPRFQL